MRLVYQALRPFKDPLYVPIGVLNAAVITTSFDFLLIDYNIIFYKLNYIKNFDMLGKLFN